jgi:hypothetical protein
VALKGASMTKNQKDFFNKIEGSLSPIDKQLLAVYIKEIKYECYTKAFLWFDDPTNDVEWVGYFDAEKLKKAVMGDK